MGCLWDRRKTCNFESGVIWTTGVVVGEAERIVTWSRVDDGLSVNVAQSGIKIS